MNRSRDNLDKEISLKGRKQVMQKNNELKIARTGYGLGQLLKKQGNLMIIQIGVATQITKMRVHSEI